MKTKPIAALCAIVAAIGVARANDSVAIGPGAQTCTKYLAFWAIAKSRPDLDQGLTENMFFMWAEGYMTALNLNRTDGKYAVLSEKGIQNEQNTLWNFCDEHPNAYYFEAVNALYASLPAKQLSK